MKEAFPLLLPRVDSVSAGDVQSEDELFDFDMETDQPNWQQLVSREVLLGLKPSEIKRQEVINGELWRRRGRETEEFQAWLFHCFL